jgi:hypothetical protein
MCDEGKYTFSGFISGAFTTFFCPGISDSVLDHCFLDVMMFSVQTCQYMSELAQSVCDWAAMLTVFIMIQFSVPHYV